MTDRDCGLWWIRWGILLFLVVALSLLAATTLAQHREPWTINGEIPVLRRTFLLVTPKPMDSKRARPWARANVLLTTNPRANWSDPVFLESIGAKDGTFPVYLWRVPSNNLHPNIRAVRFAEVRLPTTLASRVVPIPVLIHDWTVGVEMSAGLLMVQNPDGSYQYPCASLIDKSGDPVTVPLVPRTEVVK